MTPKPTPPEPPAGWRVQRLDIDGITVIVWLPPLPALARWQRQAAAAAQAILIKARPPP